MQVSAHQAPWGAVALVAVNVAIFALAGAAPDYGGTGIDGDRDVPSIGRLLFDVFRHPQPQVLVATVLVLVPVSAAVERVVGAVGMVAIYLVAGFATGFVEVISRSHDVTVAGALGGTTALLVAWSVTRWRDRWPLPLIVMVMGGWLWSMVVLRPDGIPVSGVAVAVWLGVYAIGAHGRWTKEPR